MMMAEKAARMVERMTMTMAEKAAQPARMVATTTMIAGDELLFFIIFFFFFFLSFIILFSLLFPSAKFLNK